MAMIEPEDRPAVQSLMARRGRARAPPKGTPVRRNTE